MIKLTILFLTFFLSVFTLVSDNVLITSEVNLVLLSIIILLDYFDKKSLSLFQVWQVGFIFIILSEAILIEPGVNILNAIRYLFIANYLVIIGYNIPVRFKRFRSSYIFVNKIRASKWTPYIIIILLFGYIIYTLPAAILTYNMGRNAAASILFEDRNLFLGSFFKALGFVLPSIIVFYYKEIKKKKNILIPLFLSMPIFIILFIGGSRFPLLFSFGGFLIVAQAKSNGRITLNIKLVGFMLFLIISSFIMAQFRGGGLSDFDSITKNKISETRLSKRIASEMSPEGVVDMTALSMTYFESNPHTYGKSITFLTYFWVPRTIWPDKPTMIGHWLIRKYRSGFSEGHSASFGFTGELYADFGYFSLIFVLLIGLALKWADYFRAYHLSKQQSYDKILVGMLFSYVFFFIRSPITSTMTFLSILLVYYLIRKILFKKVTIKRNRQFK